MHCWDQLVALSAQWQGWWRLQRQKSSPQRVQSPLTALWQISRLRSVGAAALSKPRRDMSDFRQEEQLVIKNNNIEVFELYFPWLPHAQNLNPTDKSCTFGFDILMLFYSRAGWSPQPGFVRWHKEFPWHLAQSVLLIPPCLQQSFITLRGSCAWLCCQQIVLKWILTSYSHFDPRHSSKTDIRENLFVGFELFLSDFFSSQGIKACWESRLT